MDNIKKLIVLIVIIILIILMSLIIIKYVDKKDREENFENTLTMEVENTISILDNRNEFFAVKSCITKYLSYVSLEDDEIVYAILDKNYIEEYNINRQNVLLNLDKYNNPVFYSDKIYVIQNTAEVYTYFIYGNIVDKDTMEKDEFKIVVRMDKEKDLFSFISYRYIEDKQYNIKLGNTIAFEYDYIENKQYNKFAFKNISDNEIIVHYFNEMKDNVIYNVENLYRKLQQEYRQRRFSNIEEFKNYINNNITDIYSAKVDKYDVKEYKEYTQYICIDQNNNYYIINETYPGQYTLILDTYTIDLPEYLEKYNEANEQQKTAYCIDRFIQAINDENYKFAYELLADGFKNNYFKTESAFENYAKQYLLAKEKIAFNRFNNEGNLYNTYTVTLKNKNDETNSIEKTFIVKLGEGTDFEISFNVD